MCGIAGIVWSNGRSDNRDDRIVDRMVAAIEHRGPDSDGRSRTSFADVGFRRLSIIDLAGGDQPLSNETGSIECFLNGEIYNYMELRKDLVARGHQFQTASDTEVLPHLYEEFGTDMFSHLNGMFVVCIIDRANREVLLARDQFGVKQLYFGQTAQGMVFGSEVKALLASGLISPDVDESSVLSYLTLFYCPEPHTLVRGVLKLPPGSWMRLRPGAAEEIARYYEVPSNPRWEKLDLKEASERTRSLLWQSVELQLHADVPVGISLSGGIDSSAIACAAVDRQSNNRPLALTIHWPDTTPDEVESAVDLCHRRNIQHEVLEIEVENLLDELPLLGWISDEPIADPAIYSQFCIARVAAKHVKVLLSGAGGDELFGGYGSYRLAKRFAAYNILPQTMQQGLRPFLSDNWMDGDSLDAIDSYRKSRLPWHSRTKSNLTREDRRHLTGYLQNSRNPFANFENLFSRYGGYDPANQQMIVDFNTYLPEQILPMMDRATMAASIEGRVPFLDGPLVSHAFSLSAAVKMGTPPEGKRVLKRAIQGDVSLSILRRKKAGMPSPFISFLTKHVAAIRHILLSPDSYVRSILPVDWLTALTSNQQAAREGFRVLYALLTLEIWHKLFLRDQLFFRSEVSSAELFKIPSRALSV